jgi:uncharacterized repeat protein (TIGR02543 family)
MIKVKVGDSTITLDANAKVTRRSAADPTDTDVLNTYGTVEADGETTELRWMMYKITAITQLIVNGVTQSMVGKTMEEIDTAIESAITLDDAGHTLSLIANYTGYAGSVPQATVATGSTATVASMFTLIGSTALTAIKASNATNYTFAGWNTKADGTGTTISESATTAFSDDLVLYAIWTPITLTITLNAGTGKFSDDSTTANVTINKGQTLATLKLASGYKTPTLAVHTFAGWTADTQTNELIADTSTFASSGTITAVYTAV